MKHFWQGFGDKKASGIQFKKHVIMVFWSPDNEKSLAAKNKVQRLSQRYPSVKVKVVNVKKDPTKPSKHNVSDLPAVVLLKDGREVDRILKEKGDDALLEHLFRRAAV